MLIRLLVFILIFLFYSHLGYSQKDTTIYYKANNKPALSKKDAVRCIKIKKKKKNFFCIKTLNKFDGVWEQSKVIQDVYIQNNFLIKIKVKDGDFNTYILRHYKQDGNYFHILDFDIDQTLLSEGRSRSILIPDWEGQVKTYFKSGKIKSISHYENNQLVSNELRMKSGELLLENVFETADVMPQFVKNKNGLAKYLAESVKFPWFAKDNNIKGCVVVKFIVDEQGHIFGEHIQESDHTTLDDEALRVVRNMPQWSPAILDGKPVKVLYSMAINFKK